MPNKEEIIEETLKNSAPLPKNEKVISQVIKEQDSIPVIKKKKSKSKTKIYPIDIEEQTMPGVDAIIKGIEILWRKKFKRKKFPGISSRILWWSARVMADVAENKDNLQKLEKKPQAVPLPYYIMSVPLASSSKEKGEKFTKNNKDAIISHKTLGGQSLLFKDFKCSADCPCSRSSYRINKSDNYSSMRSEYRYIDKYLNYNDLAIDSIPSFMLENFSSHSDFIQHVKNRMYNIIREQLNYLEGNLSGRKLNKKAKLTKQQRIKLKKKKQKRNKIIKKNQNLRSQNKNERDVPNKKERNKRKERHNKKLSQEEIALKKQKRIQARKERRKQKNKQNLAKNTTPNQNIKNNELPFFEIHPRTCKNTDQNCYSLLDLTFEQVPSTSGIDYIKGNAIFDRKVDGSEAINRCVLDIPAMKKALDDEGVIVFAMTITKSFYSELMNNKSEDGIYYSNNEYGGRQVMLIYGYTKKTNRYGETKEYFKVLNSWGEDFGINGTCYIETDYLKDNIDLNLYKKHGELFSPREFYIIKSKH